MGDFYQNGLITTLHNFRTRPVEDMERELLEFSKNRPMALILPCLYSELAGPALEHIVDELTKTTYLSQIIIGLDQATEAQFRHAKQYFSRLPQHHRILWNDGPHLKELHNKLSKEQIAPEHMGKGRNAWYCFGYFIASDIAEAVALHDCDILTYSRDLLGRLFYPVVNPNFNFRFCKGYYYRASDDQLQGRVARLLVTPLLRTLKTIFGYDDFLEYLDSFRYPLSGEFSMRSDIVKTIRIPSDWGLEIGILSEVHRNNSTNRICQVDIADRYDHKHQEVSPDDLSKGLAKMSIDISKAIFVKLASNGAIFSQGTFRSIKSTYYRYALEFSEQYHSDAVINGMKLDRHAEENMIDLFAQNVYRAGELFLANPMQSSLIPSWKRVTSALPNFSAQFNEAVELDNK